MAQKPNIGLETHPAGGGAALNAIVNANWEGIDNWFDPALGALASQTGTTLTSDVGIFTAGDAGATIRWADGTTDTIDSVTNDTTVEMDTSQTKASQSFELYRTGESMRAALARGLTKLAAIPSAADGRLLVWNDTLNRFEFTDGPLSIDDNGNLLVGDATPAAPASLTDGIVIQAGTAASAAPAAGVAIWNEAGDLKSWAQGAGAAAWMVNSANQDSVADYTLTNSFGATGIEVTCGPGTWLLLGTFMSWPGAATAADDCTAKWWNTTDAADVGQAVAFRQTSGENPTGVTVPAIVTVASGSKTMQLQAVNTVQTDGELLDLYGAAIRLY